MLLLELELENEELLDERLLLEEEKLLLELLKLLEQDDDELRS